MPVFLETSADLCWKRAARLWTASMHLLYVVFSVGIPHRAAIIDMRLDKALVSLGLHFLRGTSKVTLKKTNHAICLGDQVINMSVPFEIRRQGNSILVIQGHQGDRSHLVFICRTKPKIRYLANNSKPSSPKISRNIWFSYSESWWPVVEPDPDIFTCTLTHLFGSLITREIVIPPSDGNNKDKYFWQRKICPVTSVHCQDESSVGNVNWAGASDIARREESYFCHVCCTSAFWKGRVRIVFVTKSSIFASTFNIVIRRSWCHYTSHCERRHVSTAQTDSI